MLGRLISFLRRFRRLCYDKAHRCPGWAGGGLRWAYDDTKPDDWNEDLGPWETSNSRRRHWWQQPHRCDDGRIWNLIYRDPWRSFRFGKCTKCDIIALPRVTRILDLRDWWWHTFLRDTFIRSPQNLWYSIQQEGLRLTLKWSWFRVRWWFVDRGDWFKHLYRWYYPGYRRILIAEQRESYGVKA